jgi:response regulator RpfG family c-di-GMP phosphodiesterase
MPVLKAAMIIAAQHHERWDGMGYPHRLKGEDIHLYGRIGGLADVFDALGSHRCYKKAWPLEDVLQTLRDERGRHFEPVLVDLFLDNLDQFIVIRDRFEDPPPPVLP